MPGRLDQITHLLAAVEQKEFAFLETLTNLKDYQIEPGRVEILGSGEGRAYFRRQSNGLPLWSDLSLQKTSGASSGQSFEINLDFAEYNPAYTGLKARHLAATQDNLPLDETARQQLQDAMLSCLDPDRNTGDTH